MLVNFRPCRETFDEAMKVLKSFNTIDLFLDFIKNDYGSFAKDNMVLEYYNYDDRIKNNCFLISYLSYNVHYVLGYLWFT